MDLSWSAPAFTGGVPILDYTLAYDVAGSTETLLGITETEYVITDLTPGEIYKFTIKARNSFGMSTESLNLALTFMYNPDPPLAVSSTNEGDLVTIEWSGAKENGSPITQYKVFINDVEETTNCVSLETKCQVS